MKLNFLRLWSGPLPKEELFLQNSPNPILHWLIHPIKRRIAKIYLKILQKFFGLKVIAIGGSNGKTTTRNMLLTLLPKAIATRDSVTSTYNIPSSILRLRPWTKFFICEMSVEYIGDMDFYLWLAKPDIAILTLIDIEHTKYFGSIENTAREELKLLRGKWTKIVNGNSPLIPYKNYSNCFTFGASPAFDCHIESAHLTKDFTTKVKLVLGTRSLELVLPAIGQHLSHPLAAAILTADKLGLKIENCKLKIEQLFTCPPHRLQMVHSKSGALFIDDTYNSNPSSAKAAIETAVQLAKLTKRELILVLSQMNELGPYEVSEHQKLKDFLSKLDIRYSNIFSVGPAASKIGQNFSSPDELLKQLNSLALSTKHLVLFKSSRSWKLENLIDQLT